MIQVPGLGTRCVLVFLLSSGDCPLSVPMPPPPPPPKISIRTVVQNVTSSSTQHSAGQLAPHKHLLALSIRYSHQTIAGLLFLPPLHMFQLHSSVRERSGRRQPPAERSPVLFLPHRVPPGIRRSTRYQVPVVRVCSLLVFLLSSLILFSISVFFAIFPSQTTPVLLRIRT